MTNCAIMINEFAQVLASSKDKCVLDSTGLMITSV